MELDLIRIFSEIAARESFTAAATALSMPKSTVSRKLSRLEAELGTPLVLRTTRRLRLTDAGKLYYERISPALERLHEATSALAEQASEPRGVLRISVPPDYETLPRVATAFTAQYPQVSLEFDTSSRYVDMVGEDFDAAIRAGHLEDSTIIAHKLATTTFGLFASTSYLEQAGRPASFAELPKHRCILLRRRAGLTHRWKLQGPAGPEEVTVRGTMVVNDLMFVRSAVVHGAGIGLLPRHAVRAFTNVEPVLPDYEGMGADVHLVYPGSRTVPAKLRAFRDLLLSHDWFGEVERAPRPDSAAR